MIGYSQRRRLNAADPFTGDIDDLTALGFTPLSVNRHPAEGFTIEQLPRARCIL